MSRYAFIHFAGKLPRNTGNKAVVAVTVCSDFEGYNVLAKRVRVVENSRINNKYTGLMALEEAFNYIYDEQYNMIKAGVNRVYLVTDSPITFAYLTKKSANDYVKNFLRELYERFSFGGPKELRVGVGVGELCFRNSAKSRCNVGMIYEEKRREEELKGKDTIFCFTQAKDGREFKKLTEFIHSPKIDGLEESLELVE